MTFNDCIQDLQTLAIKKGIHYQLSHLKPILNALGNPQKKLPKIIQIAGTNGKGSTLAFTQSILRQAGHAIGTFTSPHLNCYTERIAINNTPISHSKFVHYYQRINAIKTEGLTEFETLTLMAVCYFSDTHCDACLFEVGLGGRLDATSILTPDITIITNIAKDHEAILGDTIEKIATEKAGIIKEHIPIITTSTQDPAALSIIKHIATQKKAPLILTPPIAQLPKAGHLRGPVQHSNASLAIAAAQKINPNIETTHISQGLKSATHWGRLTLTQEHPPIIVDAAHNPAGLDQLQHFIHSEFPQKKITVIFGLHKHKNHQHMCEQLQALADTLYFCEFDTQFSASLEDIQAHFKTPLKRYLVNTPLPKAECLVLTGSIYFIGPMQKKLVQKGS